MTKLEKIYVQAIEVARQTKQITGEKNEYYITIYQLEQIIKSLQSL